MTIAYLRITEIRRKKNSAHRVPPFKVTQGSRKIEDLSGAVEVNFKNLGFLGFLKTFKNLKKSEF